MKDIRQSKLYKSFNAKFDVDIKIKDGQKQISNMPSWSNIKTDMTSNRDNIAIISGKVNDIVVIDLDKPKEGEIDGIRYFEDNVCKIEKLNTLITKSIRGGFHIYYKYNNKLKSGVRIKDINKDISIDIRSDKTCLFEGRGYELYNDVEELLPVPEKFLKLLKREKEREKYDETIGKEQVQKEGIELILNSLHSDYFDNYLKWFNVLCVLKNIGVDIEVAKNFSKLSLKYDEQCFNKIWNYIEVREKPTIGTLYHYMRQSVGKNKYDYIMKKLKDLTIKDPELTKLNLSDFECYKLFVEKYNNKLLTDTDGNIFICNEFGIWNSIKKDSLKLYKIIEEFYNYLKENNYEYSLDKSNKRVEFINNIVIYLQKEDLKFDSNPYILGFKNGVVDLLKKEFRIAKPEEYIYLTTGYDFVKKETFNNIDKFFNDIFDSNEIKEYFLNSHCLSLEKLNREQTIIFYVGYLASNGKSLTCSLFKKAFGNLGVRFPTNLLTEGRENASNSNSALMVLKDKLFSYCSEPEEGKKININIVKEISGDIMSGRQLYKEQTEFTIFSSIVLCCNTLPELDGVDNGIKRRIRAISFNNVFTNNPVKPNERKLTVFSNEEIEELKHELINLLIDKYYNLYLNNYEYNIPEEVKVLSQDIINDSNTLEDFILESFEYKEGEYVKLKDIKQILLQNKIKINLSSLKNKFKQLLNVDYVKEKRINGDKVYNFFINLTIN